jgi:hypothetical protein
MSRRRHAKSGARLYTYHEPEIAAFLSQCCLGAKQHVRDALPFVMIKACVLQDTAGALQIMNVSATSAS